MRTILFTLAIMFSAFVLNAKTLVVYYSYTNNVERIVSALNSQISCDIVEIEPAEKGLDYAANNYAVGSEQIAAIRNNPNDASSYPAIDSIDVDFDKYDMVIVAAPLWWSQMAAPLQSFLFSNGEKMAGKKIGVIVSSASSGISGVVADAKRLIPEGIFIEPYLWIRSSQTSNAASHIASWLNDIHYNDITAAISSTPTDNDFEITLTNGMVGVKGDFNKLTFYSLSGHKVMETSARMVSTDLLVPGVYFAQARNGKRAITRKINIR